MGKKLTKEDFVKKGREKHGDKYDYSKVDYVNSKTKVCIICPKPGHGEFWQVPSGHLSGKGCSKCGVLTIGDSRRLSKEEFIKRANEKHEGKYDYSNVKYEGAHTKVCIVCPKHGHGEFWQTPNSHIRGCGCPKCKGEAIGDSKRSSKKEFIKKAHEKHGDKYDYTKVKYVNDRTKVCIICTDHGEFKQIPSSHLSGCGCPKCGQIASNDSKRLSKELFIQKANKKHHGKYDYFKVDYKDSKTKVCIVCPEDGHGEFWQTPANHLYGEGCPKCANEANAERCRSSKEEFIKKANEKHEGKYDYSKVKYVNDRTKVCIICNKHGEFWQEVSSHLQGRGCPECGQIARADSQRLSKEEFIKRANEVHKGKYDYSKVKYMNYEAKVCIICPEYGHGEFWQSPDTHIQGCGCHKCGRRKTADSRRLSKEEFIKKANEVHYNKYDYSKVKYIDSQTKVCIICKEHGEFEQIPSNHTRGAGCPKCNLSHLERSVMNYLDDVGIAYDYQKRFDWMGQQSLDFYLPDYNVGIECQGEQHFFPVDFAGKGVEWACKQFDKVVSLDKKKKKLCEKHGIKLLYFGNVPNYDTFLDEAVHDDVQYLIDYLEEHKKTIDHAQIIQVDI